MEFSIKFVNEIGQIESANVICFNLLDGIQDFCEDHGVQLSCIKAIIVIDE
jgi:hypothetical protein